LGACKAVAARLLTSGDTPDRSPLANACATSEAATSLVTSPRSFSARFHGLLRIHVCRDAIPLRGAIGTQRISSALLKFRVGGRPRTNFCRVCKVMIRSARPEYEMTTFRRWSDYEFERLPPLGDAWRLDLLSEASRISPRQKPLHCRFPLRGR